jgi:lipoprotein-releasing system permease protein
MERPEGCHFADVFLREGRDAESLIPDIEKILGPGFVVLNEDKLHQDLFKVMKIEKLFVFLALGFIILISGFNLFVSSSMMVINKRKDFAILAALGMQAREFSGIIRATGLLLVSAGLLPGLGLGAFLCFLQMKYGFIPLGMSTTTVKAYPVELHFTDASAVAIWVLVSAFLALLVPANRAAAESDLKI